MPSIASRRRKGCAQPTEPEPDIIERRAHVEERKALILAASRRATGSEIRRTPGAQRVA